RHRPVLDLSHKPDFTGATAVSHRYCMLYLCNIECDKRFSIIRHGSPSVREDRPVRATLVSQSHEWAGHQSQPGNMTSSDLRAVTAVEIGPITLPFLPRTPVERHHRYRPVLFFVTAYLVTWIPWAIGAYVGSRKGLQSYALLYNHVGLLGPM